MFFLMCFCWIFYFLAFFIFFFQAEDGIRDYKVTGVQTCALPILWRNGEAPVVHGSVALEDRVRLRDRARAGEPELRDEAILERAPESLDPPLRLWRERVDGLDRQRLERLADL